jgi:autotransporter-associated beta strand protein
MAMRKTIQTTPVRSAFRPRAAASARVVAVAAALLVGAQPVLAADKFYDTSSAAGLTGGSGIWDVGTTAVWSITSAGSALTTFAAGDDALFQTGTAAAVAIAAGGVSANSLSATVASSAPTFTGGALTLTSTSTAAAVDGSAIFNTGTGTNLAFNNTGGIVLGAAAGLTQTFTLNGGTLSTGTNTAVTGSGVTLSLVGNGGKTMTFNGAVNVGNLAIGGTGTTTTGPNTFVFANAVTLGTAAEFAIANANAVVRLGSSAASTFGTTNTINVTSGVLQFANAASLGTSALTIAGGSIDSSVANLVLNTTNAITLNGNATFVGTQNLSLGTNGVSLGSAAGTARTITTAAGTLTINGAITDGATATQLTKAGAGTLLLNGAASYTGLTTISNGLLRFGTTATVPAGSITISNIAGALAAAGPAGFSTFNEWLGSGKIATASVGALALTNATETAAIDLLTPNYNSLSVGATTNVTYTGTLTPGTNGYRLGGGGGTLIYPGVLDGARSLTTLGNVTLSSPTGNTYTGTTSAAAGLLVVTSPTALGTTAGGTNVAAGAALQPQGGITIAGEALTLNAVTSTVNLPNGLANGAGNNTWAGPITLAGDGSNNVRVGNTTAGNTLNLTGPITAGGTFGTITGAGATGLVVAGAGDINISGPISGALGLITTNTGTVTLSSTASTFTGGVRFQGATTFVVSSFNSVVANTSSANPAGSSLGAPTTDAAGTIFFAANNTTVNAGTLRYVGPGEATNRILMLNGSSGGITLDQSGPAGSALTFTAALASTATGGKTLTLTGSTAGTGEFAGLLANGSGTLAVAKTGTGTWTLSGANTYTGATTITGGTLLANNTSASATGTGAVAVNTAGTLGGTGSITGALTVGRGGRVAPGGAYPAGGVDNLSLAAAGIFNKAVGTGAVGPTFLSKLSPSTGTADVLTFTGASAAGAIDLSGDSDVLDLAPIEAIGSASQTFTVVEFTGTTPAGFGTGRFDVVTVGGQSTQSTAPGDPNYVLVNYVTGASPAITVTVANVAAVPEPAVAGGLALAAVGLLARRRRVRDARVGRR